MSIALRAMTVLAGRKRLGTGLSDTAASGSGVGAGPFTTGAITATVGGGVAPYTYAWEPVGGDSSITISNAVVAGPTWSASGSAPSSKSATWRCLVTDAAGVSAYTGNVTVTIQFQVASLTVGLSIGAVSGGGTGSGPFSTANVTAQPSGGQAPYSYDWEFVSGSVALAPTADTAATTAFSASGTAPEVKTGSWRCKVTDNLGTVAYSAGVAITLNFQVSTLTVGLSGGAVSGSGTGNGPFSTGGVTATPSGGSAPYSYDWEFVSGSGAIAPTADTAASTAFSASGTAPETKNASWRCKVTDNLGTVAYSGNVTVSIEFAVSSLGVSLDTNTLSGGGTGSGPFSTGSVTASPSGGQAPYSYLWERVSGDLAINPASGSAAATTFASSGTAPENKTGSWRCKVTDNLGSVAYSANVDIAVNFAVAALVAAVDNTSPYGLRTANGTGPCVSDLATASASGGQAPYSYLWERLSGDATTIPSNGATSAATPFFRMGAPVNIYNSQWRCKVTDNLGTIAYAPNVNVNLEFASTA